MRWIVFTLMLIASTAKGAEYSKAQKEAMERLGYHIYHDPRLSKEGKTSCFSCHDYTKHGGGDGVPLAIGRKGSRLEDNGGPNGVKGKRRSPHIYNLVRTELLGTQKMFLDLRAENPVEQVLGPIENPQEMGPQTKEEAVGRLARLRQYKEMTVPAFGDGNLTVNRLAIAVVAFERLLSPVDTPIVRYIAAESAPWAESVRKEYPKAFKGIQPDINALSDAAKRGTQTAAAKCFRCHQPPTFTSGLAANNGGEACFGIATSDFKRCDIVAERGGAKDRSGDIGLEKTTEKKKDRRAFKITGWTALATRLDIKAEGPLLHNGNCSSLDRLLDHYNQGCRFVVNGKTIGDPYCDEGLKKPLGLSKSGLADLKACLLEGTYPFDLPTHIKPPKEHPQ